MLDSSPDVIVFALDTEYNYLAFNSRHKEVIKNIWGKDIAVGTNMLAVIGNHDDAKKAKGIFDRALRGESFVIAEEYGDEKLSRQNWLDYYSPIRNLDGSIMGFSCFLMNNTKQKNAQDRIETLLSEKELILKEVHHRIKNSMNTISSLLSLQEDSVKDASAILALQDAGNRIKSMSLLYDKLYRSLDYTEMSVKDYVSTLVDEVIANFPNNKIVTIDKDLQDFPLDVKRLQSLGIIINELLTNTMKYAFPGRDSGHISVSALSHDGHITITVQDDGVGVPESMDFRNSTGFGLQLVLMLSEQLKGTVEMAKESGTRFVVEFES
jgi:two-component sensor histidine kinase